MRTTVSGALVLLCSVALATVSCNPDEPEEQGSIMGPPALATTAVSAYDIVKVSSMTIDGNLADWASVSPISIADDPANGRGALNNTATVKLAWNDTYLYAAYNVTDTDLRADQTTRDHPATYKDDEVELYIDPQGDGGAAPKMTRTDYQLLANILETVSDYSGDSTGGKDVGYTAASLLAKVVMNGSLNATGADVGYATELRVSWADLGITPSAGHFMRIDLAVGDRDGDQAPGNTQEFDWAGLPAFNNPSGWKDVQLVNPPPPVSAYDLVKVPSITMDGSLADWAGVAPISMADSSDRPAGLDNKASVRLAWNDTYLFAAYNVTDTDLRGDQTTRDHAATYKDDEMELYIDPQGDGSTAPKMDTTDYQLLANILETVADYRGNGTGGKDQSYTAASLLAKVVMNGSLNATGADVGYATELRVSWADLGITPSAGHFMRIDLAVGDRDGDPAPSNTEEFDWAGLPAFNNPSGWKDVQLRVDNTAPAAPTNPSLTVVSASQINVVWSASTSGDAAGYNIYRSTTGTPVFFKKVSGSPYQDSGLAAGTSYTYQISTLDAAGNESAKTATQSASTPSGSAPGGTIGAAPRDGAIIDISGNPHRTTQYDGQTANNNTGFRARQRVEAGTGASLTTWRNDSPGDPQQRNTAVRNLGYGGADDWSFHGGRVLGDSPEDGSWPWNTDNTHDFHGHSSLKVEGGKRGLIEHFAARNTGDGIGFTFGALDSKDGGVVRWSALEAMGDNAISNDTKHAITIYQNYISGVSFYESRPDAEPEESYDASHKVVRLDGNMLWLKPKRFSDMKPWSSGSLGDPVVLSMFKLQVTQPAYNTQLAFYNNVLRYDGVNGEDQAERVYGNGVILGSGFAARVTTQGNNVVLFPNRTSGHPKGWPITGLESFTYLYGNAAKARWNQEIRAWMQAHPQVPVSDPGLFPGF